MLKSSEWLVMEAVFFRSVAIVGSPELQVAERNAQYLCIGQDEQLFELAMAEKLTHDVV